MGSANGCPQRQDGALSIDAGPKVANGWPYKRERLGIGMTQPATTEGYFFIQWDWNKKVH